MRRWVAVPLGEKIIEVFFAAAWRSRGVAVVRGSRIGRKR